MTAEAAEQPGWVPATDTFAARLALVRQRKGWNVKEAAMACGLPPSSWRGWEEGSQPRDYVSVCRSISRRTGVHYSWLLSGAISAEGLVPSGGKVASDAAIRALSAVPSPRRVTLQPHSPRPLLRSLPPIDTCNV